MPRTMLELPTSTTRRLFDTGFSLSRAAARDQRSRRAALLHIARRADGGSRVVAGALARGWGQRRAGAPATTPETKTDARASLGAGRHGEIHHDRTQSPAPTA